MRLRRNAVAINRVDGGAPLRRTGDRVVAVPAAHGVVAGSAAWYDGTRGVLSLMRDPVEGEDRLLECVKANYGRTGWGARLTERNSSGAYRGLKLAVRLDRSDLEIAKAKDKKPASNGAGIPGRIT